MAIRATGSDLVMFDFDQSPFHMNEAGSKGVRSLAMRGQSDVVLKEGHAATRERWTANTMTTSDPNACGGAVPPLELMFRVQSSGKHVNPRMRGFIPRWSRWMTVVTSDSGSYKEDDVLSYIDRVMVPRPNNLSPWRLLIVDAYAAQTADAVRRLAWQRGYALCIHGGGATGVCQPNDTDLHQAMKQASLHRDGDCRCSGAAEVAATLRSCASPTGLHRLEGSNLGPAVAAL